LAKSGRAYDFLMDGNPLTAFFLIRRYLLCGAMPIAAHKEHTMDSLDKLEVMPTTPLTEAPADDFDVAAIDVADEDDSEVDYEEKPKTNWWKIAAYTAAGLAVVGAAAGYAYWRAQQKPQSRLERLRTQLGLANVDVTRLPSSLRDIDFARLNQTGRQVGTYARKATHVGAKKVAEFTR
jgi:hypothetical protein